MTQTLQPSTKVRWGRVALFYGLALGWCCLLAVGLFLLGERDLSSVAGPTLGTAILAVLYMPAPLVAALIVERLDRRPALIRTTFVGFRRALPTLLLVAVVIVPATLLTMVGVSWLAGNVLGISGPGTVLFGQADLVANALTLLPAQNASQVAQLSAGIPPFWGLVALAVGGGLLAGFTINGLFAFGEEYGWRGWLADELRPLGAFWANVITGVLWGLWHAPLILLGFNYGTYGRIGTAFMVALCIPFSFLLWRAREVTGSLLAPAILHGAFNGVAGLFAVLLVDANPLIAAPVGLIGAGAIAVIAALFWLLTRRVVRHEGAGRA
ncbi:MAG TPA: CPBP family intramembrane glutamic endopeptidase [Propionicimonas sp.]|uniref:CPBP family intramembrane glutamic endopeptidase n=1 Tax=Propionicimonas sp. TaxID=1955623 RepID=UPI002F3E209F